MLTPADATARPGEGAILQRVGRQAPYWGGPNVLLVLDARRRSTSVDYVKVLLKRMPAGLGGWVPADAVKLARTTRRVVVDLSSRTVTIRDAGKALLRARAVIGAPLDPHARGQFAVDAPVDQPASAHLGRRILAIAAYSRALARYQGGIPQTAFHAYEQARRPPRRRRVPRLRPRGPEDPRPPPEARPPRHPGPHPHLSEPKGV